MRCLSVCACLSVCLSVTFLNSVKTNKRVFKNFPPSSSQAILVFPHQTSWQYSDGNLPNGGVEFRWCRQKSRFWAYIWLHCVLSTLRPARYYQHGAAGPRFRELWYLSLIVSGVVCWWRETTTIGYDKKFYRYAKDDRTAFNCTQW